MKKNISLFLVVSFIIITIGCVDLASENDVYKIVNTTENEVKLILFDRTTKKEIKSVSGGQNEVLLEIEIKKSTTYTPLAEEVFEADSIAVIFNNSRVEGHITFIPESNSLFAGSFLSYEFNDDKNGTFIYTYEIDMENFDNAVPCDGSCD